MNSLRLLFLALVSIAFVLAQSSTASAADETESNLLQNANFEKGADGWELNAFGKKGTMAIDQDELRDGKPTLRITSVDDLTFVYQTVKVKPNTRYRLSGYLKTKDVRDLKGRKNGAMLLVGMSNGSGGIRGTTGWRKVSMDLNSQDKTEIRVGGAVGYYASPVAGTAWFSDLSLVELGRTH